MLRGHTHRTPVDFDQKRDGGRKQQQPAAKAMHRQRSTEKIMGEECDRWFRVGGAAAAEVRVVFEKVSVSTSERSRRAYVMRAGRSLNFYVTNIEHTI
jgi:hypothetical protein